MISPTWSYPLERVFASYIHFLLFLVQCTVLRWVSSWLSMISSLCILVPLVVQCCYWNHWYSSLLVYILANGQNIFIPIQNYKSTAPQIKVSPRVQFLTLLSCVTLHILHLLIIQRLILWLVDRFDLLWCNKRCIFCLLIYATKVTF